MSGRASMREGPLSDLFRSTDSLSNPPERRSEPDDRPGVGLHAGVSNYVAVIRVVGVGGAGCNAINRMIEAGVRGVEFVAVNTDRQALDACEADVRIPVGLELTRGLGTGGDAGAGAQAVRDGEDHIRRALRGSDLVFVAAGEGGGTGTGGAPAVARISREMGALTVAVVTRPFAFEGNRRVGTADQGIEELKNQADTVIVIPNDRLMAILERGTSMVDAFRVCDDLLRQGVQGITDLITLPGLINLDFADVRAIMSGAGTALLGIGYAGGGNRAVEAARAAINSPLLETPIDGAKGILLGITGGADLSLVEVSEAARVVAEAADPDANIIFGATVDREIEGQVWVTVVAANFTGTRAVAREADADALDGHQALPASRLLAPGRGDGRGRVEPVQPDMPYPRTPKASFDRDVTSASSAPAPPPTGGVERSARVLHAGPPVGLHEGAA